MDTALLEYIELLPPYGDKSIYDKIIEVYKTSGLHGLNYGDFRGFIFPENVQNFQYHFLFKNKPIHFYDVTFEGPASFKDILFNTPQITFELCTFKSWVSFESSEFNGLVIFDMCFLDTVDCKHFYRGPYPFTNTHFTGQYLQFKDGSLCTLYGIRLSSDTDLLIDPHVQMDPKKNRYIGTDGIRKNIREENLYIAKRQAQLTGNLALIKDFEDRFEKYHFDYDELTDDIARVLFKLQMRANSHRLEDLYNDYVNDGLEFIGYRVKDQTRGGASASGNSAGELDIAISNRFGIQMSILEALRLSSVDQSNIASHINKLINKYDRSGHLTNYIIVYYEGNDLASFFDRYKKFIDEDLNKHKDFNNDADVIKSNEIFLKKTDVKLLKCVHKKNNIEIFVNNFIVKINQT